MLSINQRMPYPTHNSYFIHFTSGNLESFLYDWPDLDPCREGYPVDFSELPQDDLDMIEACLIANGIDYYFTEMGKEPDETDYDAA